MRNPFCHHTDDSSYFLTGFCSSRTSCYLLVLTLAITCQGVSGAALPLIANPTNSSLELDSRRANTCDGVTCKECVCFTPSCYCIVSFSNLIVDGVLKNPSVTTGQTSAINAIRLTVAIACSSLRRPATSISDITYSPKLVDKFVPITSNTACTDCSSFIQVAYLQISDVTVGSLKLGSSPITVSVGRASACGTSDSTCQPCGSTTSYLSVRVYAEFSYVAASNGSATRLLLGIVFAIVWTIIMVVPVIVWLRRRRANGMEDQGGFQQLHVIMPTSRRSARRRAIRTRPRRFKAMKEGEWEGERGENRRRHGWVLSSAEVTEQSREILERNSSILGRNAPAAVVCKLVDGWCKIVRATERGQPRRILVSSEEIERESVQKEGYVLITLPQSVRYGQGVSGEIQVDIFGNIVPWNHCKESEDLRVKIDNFRGVLDNFRFSHFGNDRKELNISIERSNLWQSSFDAIMKLSNMDMLRTFHIHFVGEEGSDFGGVRREWYHLITLELVKPEYGLFEISDESYLYQLASHFDSKTGETSVGAQAVVRGDLVKLLDYFTFAGKILAKCIVDQQICSVQFTTAVYKKLLLLPFTVEDLESVDRELYHSLEWVLECNADEEDLAMYMCVDTTDVDGNYITIDLVEGGREIPVTEANKHQFVQKMINWRLVDRAAVQTDAFVAGFHSVLPLEYLQPFSAGDLELLLCGSTEIDIEDWKVNTLYKSGYSSESDIVCWFWELVRKMDNVERMRLLQFVTGTTAIPSRGFAHLQGSDGERRFSIMRVVDTRRLPQAHTCFNELVLPEYDSQDEFESKLLQAMEHVNDGILLR
uniref:HECT-type E3 ubiquitin transferase n=1 Tax=Hanusia phi TaxID=3032 RepID=A0A7S0F765_9CRYP|mmetsp:Transcript_4/g.17  ORF Transcript_4/g.17 Transcript_4/m.17 type:complete len:821 (+) Transcript_4:95-2557(+)